MEALVLNPDAGTALVPEAERTGTFATDGDVYGSLQMITKAARDQNWISAEEYQRFERGFREILPELIRQEREALRRGGELQLYLPRDQVFALRHQPRDAAGELLDGLRYIFMLARPAEAGWNVFPDCYKDDDPGNRTPGFNAGSFCCNCGLRCGKFCVFIFDCGQNGQNCDVQLGCLNAVCQAHPNAIWDPGSGICGCG
ncbi:hypothetical protein HY374_00735 [Candidatus Berkelbacteria bacterium]|nr:hypothetical protein [Candidatus Berkelbacteria bacterium]